MAIATFSFVAAALLVASAGAMTDNSATVLSKAMKTMVASDFVYEPLVKNSDVNSSLSQPRMVEQWKALEGQGIAQSYFKLGACSLRPPHVHQFAAGLLYVISASNLSVGFVTNNGTAVTNYISTGASTLFPQGLIHYQQNLGCNTATYTISYNSENPGTQVVVPALSKLPVFGASLGLDANSSKSAMSSVPAAPFVDSSDPLCVARCKLSGPVPAAAVGGR
ncbi:hypothetical protein WJX81_008222 [Elliptochloris bilobata]|uniref:Germin-like protein n=1 Tax=Elliptochloris bilobata TaxID=381761 RepID=A0AAW1RNV7_9CHLO